MKKYVILAIVLLAAYGVSMAVMWSRYEPRDVRVEFPSELRQGLIKLSPSISFHEISQEAIRETGMKIVEAPDHETFLALAKDVGDKENPFVATNVEVIEVSKTVRPKILVRYLDNMEIVGTNILLSHSDSYDWPGYASEWTATNLSHDAGDFHFDNKHMLRFWTRISILFAIIIGAICALALSNLAKPKRSQ